MSDALVSDTLERIRLTLAERYAVERELGRGGMATVYLAQDLRHERRVAIKVLKPELSVSLGGDRFLREIKLAAQLQHPNILGLFDSGEADGLLHYVMPFVEGESLRDKLDREQQLAIEEAIQIIREAADGLGYAHSRGIVHRDIKPENILISGGHALVADFGIARAVSEAGGQKLTETGMAVGTPYYMSPEQAMGGGVDARSDIYSLGCVLYELLAGTPPFTGPTAIAILARHSLEAIPSIQIVRPAVPDEVEAIIMKALAKTPADRFKTMQELADALRDADYSRVTRRTMARAIPTAELPVMRPPPTPTRKALIWTAAAAAVMGVAGAGAYAWHRSTAPSVPPAAASTPNLIKRVAVLYFQSRGGSDSLGYLADGLTETLIHQLSQVNDLRVISRNGVAPFKGRTAAPDSIAHALNVGTIVDGTVAQSGDRLRVSVSLVNAATGAEISSNTIERPRREIFSLEDDLAQAVSVMLRQQLGHEVVLQTLRASTKRPEAWELLQRAQQATQSGEAQIAAGDSAGAARSFALADTQFARTEQLDPEWSAPPTARGWLDYRLSRLARSAPAAYHQDRIQAGLAHAERALQLRPNDPDALELRGTLRYWSWLNNWLPNLSAAPQLLADAEQDLRASVTGNPAQASAWATLSHLIPNKPGGSTAEAKLAALRAYDADPYLANANVTVWRLFGLSYDLDDALEAKRWCEEGQQRFAADPRFAECQVWYLGMRGARPDVGAAWAAFNRYLERSPASLRPFNKLKGQMFLALVLARASLADSARNLMLHSRGDATVDPTRELAYYEAVGRTVLGEKDEAFRLLGVYLASNPKERESMARDEESWELKPLRSDPRWKVVVGR
ncbi:MAG TPA: serine/threonine-protein kinase [Gemmatimonadales bacterium]|nr:serine/threonine-protein kinase [Gemmatimonadales bacterium]